MTNESDLVPLHMHNLLTAGPAPWTDTRVPSEVWHVARAVYGTSTEDDEKRVYRTLQAALWKLAAPQPEAQPKWQPIETAPKDEAVLLYGAKRLEMCVGMNHSRDGWVTDTTSEWMSMYTPTHWMPLPAAPSAQAVPQLTGCNCRWDGETQMQWCELHLAHKEAIHDWAERAKNAEAKLAAPQPEAQPKWQPIETAPKDFVTEFDGWNGERVPNVTWAHPKSAPKGECAWCVEEYVSGWGYENVRVKGLTHWMPLPAAPSAQAEPQKPNYRADCWPESPHNKQAEQGGK